MIHKIKHKGYPNPGYTHGPAVLLLTLQGISWDQPCLHPSPSVPIHLTPVYLSQLLYCPLLATWLWATFTPSQIPVTGTDTDRRSNSKLLILLASDNKILLTTVSGPDIMRAEDGQFSWCEMPHKNAIQVQCDGLNILNWEPFQNGTDPLWCPFFFLLLGWMLRAQNIENWQCTKSFFFFRA